MMKEIIKNNKKYILIFCYVILILSVTSLATFQTSHSKYIDEKFNALSFKSDMYSLRGTGLNIELIQKQYEIANYRVTFNRNQVIREDEKEEYTINIPDGCSINTNESSLGTGKLSKNTISFTKKDNSNIKLNISCKVPYIIGNDVENENKQSVIFTISVIEEVEGDYSSFEYLKGRQAITSENYFDGLIEPSTSLKISKKDIANLYEQLVYLLENSYFPTYVDGTASHPVVEQLKQSIYKYVEVFKGIDESSLKEDMLKGMKVTLSDPDYYIFDIQDIFNGYALTFEQENDLKMYFTFDEKSLTLEDDIRKSFEDYLTLLYPNEEEYNLIKDYLSDKDIVNFILNNKSISGLSEQKDGKVVIVNTKYLLKSINVSGDTPIEITGDRNSIMREQYKSQLNACFENGKCLELGLVSEANAVLDSDEIKGSVTKNSSANSNPTNYDDYFIVSVYDKVDTSRLLQKILVHVSSQVEIVGENTNVTTKVNFEIIPDLNSTSVGINFEVLDNNLNITFTIPENNSLYETELLSTVKLIYSYFGREITDEEILNNLNGNTTVTLTMNEISVKLLG